MPDGCTLSNQELRDNYNKWKRPVRDADISRLNLKSDGVKYDALRELDRADTEAKKAAWCDKWGHRALSVLLDHNL